MNQKIENFIIVGVTRGEEIPVRATGPIACAA